jgi:hypothetical protein
MDDGEWAIVTVPHTWNVTPDHVDHHGVAWYRCSFAAPPSTQDKLVRLRFEAVFYEARVWLNGVLLGTHEGGYTPFEFDVSAHLLGDAENVLAVRVDNEARPDRIPTPPLGWHNDGGILRDVSLQVTHRAYVRRQRIVAVPHLVGPDEADEATLTATAWVHNAADELLHGTLVVDVLDDASGQSVLDKDQRSTLAVAPGQEADVKWTIRIASPKLWHFDHLNLYRWSTTLLGADGSPLHTDEVVFGVRSIELKEGFVLNGEPMRLVGFTRHADSPEYGAAEPVEVMKADYDDMKRLNVVLARPVHYPQHPYILDYCDRNGILLIPEVPAWQLRPSQMADPEMRELERQQLREMIESEWNHPSVWAWSVANEIASNTPEGRAFIDDMVAYVHELDPTRPVTFASDKLGLGAWRDAAGDFLMMNEYYGMWHGPKKALAPVLDVVHATWPDKGLLISEWGFAAAWRDYAGPPPRDPTRYYDVPEGVLPVAPQADEVRCQQIADQMPVFRSKPFVAGCIYWTYQDYGLRGREYVMGVVDADRKRRPSWAALRDEYAPLCFESVTFAPSSGSHRKATVTLRTRGPIESDLPVYTCRGYRLHWAVLRPGHQEPLSGGALPLPVLPPDSKWSGEIQWDAPESGSMLKLDVVRPTGFTVIERTCRPPTAAW